MWKFCLSIFLLNLIFFRRDHIFFPFSKLYLPMSFSLNLFMFFPISFFLINYLFIYHLYLSIIIKFCFRISFSIILSWVGSTHLHRILYHHYCRNQEKTRAIHFLQSYPQYYLLLMGYSCNRTTNGRRDGGMEDLQHRPMVWEIKKCVYLNTFMRKR